MSLCCFIYNSKQGISSTNDLIQSYLMQTELPTILNVLETDYELEYSEIYTGTVHQETNRIFESLLSQNCTNFVLTVGVIGVSIYCNADMGFKTFNSHARGHPRVIGIQTLKLLLKTMEKDYENTCLNGCILSSDLLQTVDVVELN
ncbi:hypothetical protein pdam_00010883 [Pocillopora damicornis]|uniref:Uncharacterized protein n=1 Tax=Pocillopora damicornis TaxID=46731 RepID=A0A3M6TM20_POCDA|nr:hypothetical protein pdam_00010883 [Pocillopora damicornis]